MVIDTIREANFAMLRETSYRETSYEVAEEDGPVFIGPKGLDLESLAVAVLAVRIEDEHGVRFGRKVRNVTEFHRALQDRRARGRTNCRRCRS
ncbi:hypothetical protein ACIQGO_28495 [Streptomyces shenzhenensis]|uniref:hypothetical protein n=1 Tax=Streptomyces shenzhenensis TaxID=943815 RepID=UPI0038007DF2